MDVSPERLVEQANERFQLQDYYGAIHLLEEVIATGRAFADAHHLLGLSYSLAGQPDKALEQLDRALALNPNYIEALIHRALVLNELGREDEANAVLRRARQVTSERRAGFHGHVAAKLANQHAALAQAYYEAGGLNEAVAQYEAALELGPGFHDLRYKLGRVLLEAGRALDAHEHFQIIVRERPSFLDAAAMLGLACYLAGDGLAARTVWEELRARRPEDPRVEAYLALLSRSDVTPVGADGGGGADGGDAAKPDRKKKKKRNGSCGGRSASCWLARVPPRITRSSAIVRMPRPPMSTRWRNTSWDANRTRAARCCSPRWPPRRCMPRTMRRRPKPTARSPSETAHGPTKPLSGWNGARGPRSPPTTGPRWRARSRDCARSRPAGRSGDTSCSLPSMRSTGAIRPRRGPCCRLQRPRRSTLRGPTRYCLCTG